MSNEKNLYTILTYLISECYLRCNKIDLFLYLYIFSALWRTTNVNMLRLLSVAVVLLSAVLLERVQGECSTSINNGCTDCMKGCATTDFKQFYYTNGAAILEQHNNLRRRYGRQDLKWSNRLEYEAWMTLEKESECSHDATNRHKDQIISKYLEVLPFHKFRPSN